MTARAVAAIELDEARRLGRRFDRADRVVASWARGKRAGRGDAVRAVSVRRDARFRVEVDSAGQSTAVAY